MKCIVCNAYYSEFMAFRPTSQDFDLHPTRLDPTCRPDSTDSIFGKYVTIVITSTVIIKLSNKLVCRTPHVTARGSYLIL